MLVVKNGIPKKDYTVSEGDPLTPNYEIKTNKESYNNN